jgi:uncharacterized membrane protein
MSGRWKTLLIVSLVVNLFLVGITAGLLFAGSRLMSDRLDRAGRRDGGRLAVAFQALPPDRRAALREMMRGPAREARPDLTEAREARMEAARQIATEPYDARVVAAALARARAADARARSRIDETLAARLAELSPQERALFAQVMMRGGRGGPRDRHRGDHGDRAGRPDR